MYGRFMKFIQRGAVRIDSGPSTGEFAQVAFQNPDESIVLVAANPAGSSPVITISFEGGMLKTQVPSESVARYRWRK